MSLIKQVKAEDTYPIRKSVLRKGMTLSYKMSGDHDDETLHIGLFNSDELVCVASFMKAINNNFEGSQYQLRGMASSNAAQGKGYGKTLLTEAEIRLKKRGVDIIWCNARTIALDFYKKLGYQTVGAMFEVPEVGPHYVMFKKLA